MVDNIRSISSHSTVKISWSAPTTRTGELMDVEQYFITVLSELNDGYGNIVFVVETNQTEIEVSNFKPQTNAFFTIVAEYQGKCGPKVTIGILTGNIA